jgi:hypothetical protein
MRRSIRTTLAAVALLVGVAACSKTPPPPQSAPAPTVSKSVTGTDLSLTADIDRDQLTVGDRITLRLIADASPAVTVDFGEQEGTLGSFDVVSSKELPGVPQGDRRIWMRELVLTTFDSGELEIPSIKVTATPIEGALPPTSAPATSPASTSPAVTAPADIAGETLDSPAIPVTVKSVVGADADPAAFRDIRGVVEVPVDRSWNWTRISIIAAIAVVVLAIIITIIVALLRRPVKLPPPAPPHVIALRRLQELAASGLIERKQFHPFHVQLADIVRTYIEQRFGIMAPEQTTEEFLREIARDERLPAQHQPTLSAFLRFADMVKFALLEPQADDSRNALSQARVFVEATVPQINSSPHPPSPSASGRIQSSAA